MPLDDTSVRLVALSVGLVATISCSNRPDSADGRPTGDVGLRVVETGPMATSRAVHAATPLPDGGILVTGGCVDDGCETRTASSEIYDSDDNAFRPGPEMSTPRMGHTSTRLADGRVLLAGGWGPSGLLASAEVYDPETGAFDPVGSMSSPRGTHQAVRLHDGSVVVLGGDAGEVDAVAMVERFDPGTGSFELLGSMITSRVSHVAVELPGGGVLAVGGRDATGRVLDTAEIFDPATGTSTSTGSMSVPRHKHAAIALADGTVLVVGGSDERDWNGTYDTAETYDPASGTFERIDDLDEARFKLRDATVRLPDGRVVVAGGSERVETYDPPGRSFTTAGGSLDTDRMFPTATLLPGGETLVAGGYDDRIRPTERAWIVRR